MTGSALHRILCGIGLILPLVALPPSLTAEEAKLADPSASEAPAQSRFRSAEDGWLDVSGFLDEAYGFIPIAIPITEPAVGLGGAGALMFVDKQPGGAKAGFGRPNITVVGALGTENGTRGAFAGDVRHWLDDRLKTVVGVIDASVNLDFYGIGRDPDLERHPKSYNLETRAAVAQARYRIGDTPFWIGLGYVRANTTVTFDLLPAHPLIPDIQSGSQVGGLLPHLSFDSRDNVFTPTAGTYLEASAGLFSKELGGDSNFQRINLVGIHFRPVLHDLIFGINAGSTLSYGEVPFYLRPFVALRGAPAMRYQGDGTAQVEAELRWQLWQRFSLLGFAGTGRAWNDSRWRNSEQEVTTYGVGFRYEIAREYGLHIGIDVATGPDGPAWYVQVGNAWMRP
ncbi:MAG: BamA/TamA family outer membrane protein [Dechloromonas sp.]|jgi:outer membrane protein assembly factor BamA|nr:BamA/TamA family outer membrane protein [Dechloromonas sp.]